MTATKQWEGRKVCYDWKVEAWRYKDTGEVAQIGLRPCGACGKDSYRMSTEFLEKYNKLEKYARVSWIKEHGGIPVDHCIYKEIVYLIENSILTESCCCGHKKIKPIVIVSKDMIEPMKKLGYNDYHKLYKVKYVFNLKGDKFNEKN